MSLSTVACAKLDFFKLKFGRQPATLLLLAPAESMLGLALAGWPASEQRREQQVVLVVVDLEETKSYTQLHCCASWAQFGLEGRTCPQLAPFSLLPLLAKTQMELKLVSTRTTTTSGCLAGGRHIHFGWIAMKWIGCLSMCRLTCAHLYTWHASRQAGYLAC